MAANKKIPAIRFKGFVEEWVDKKLEEIGEIIGGGTPSTLNKEFWNGTIDWYSPTEIGDEIYAIGSKKRITQLGLEKSSATILPANRTILFTSRAGIGDMAILKSPGATNQGFQSLVLGDKHDTYFFFSMGRLIKNFALKYSTGSTFLEISGKTLGKMPIIIPSQTEQIQIGNYFKELDGLIRQQEQKLKKVTNLKKTMLEKMFPGANADVPEIRFKGFTEKWEKKKLGDLGSVVMNKRIFKHQTKEIGEIPFYKIGTFGGKPDAFISKEIFEEYKAKYPYPVNGDILISASGSIGKIVEYLGFDEYFQDSNIVWLKHDNSVLNIFLKCFYSIVKWNGLEGSTIKRLYNSNILNTYIYLPSIQEQQKIGKYFQNLDQLINQSQQKITQLKHLKQALLQKMFI